MWRDKLLAYIDLDEPVVGRVTTLNSMVTDDDQHRVVHIAASAVLRQLVDDLADEVSDLSTPKG